LIGGCLGNNSHTIQLKPYLCSRIIEKIMDKNSIIGLGLIAAILITFSLLQDAPEPVAETNQAVENVVESNNAKTDTITSTEEITSTKIENNTSVLDDNLAQLVDSINQLKAVAEKSAKFGIFHPSAQGKEELYTIENDKLIVTLSSQGGRPVDVRLKEFQSYANYINDSIKEIVPLQLFEKDSSRFSLTLIPSDLDRPVFTKDLFFTSKAPKNIVVTEKGKAITFKLTTENENKYIEFVYSLVPNSYELNYHINIVGLENELEPSISLDWHYKGLSSEKLVDQERPISSVFYKYQNDSRDYLSENGDDEQALKATTEWVAFKHQYFSSILYSKDGFSNINSRIAVRVPQDSAYIKDYFAELNISKPISANTNIPFSFYFGPNDYDLLKSYNRGYEGLVNLGGAFFGWFNKWLIIPIFNVLNKLNLQIGLLIILMTLVIKTLILPLTYKNYISSAKMRVLKPEVDKINQKYADGKDAVKKQQEMMALYKSTGVNPMAGCIPMLIQMPILLAAFKFFPASLELRQKAFLWAEDLSAYDAVYSWSGWEVPFYGSHISLFTILMAVSTMFYTLMNNTAMSQPSQPGMPNMKVMMYIFPFMMLFFFNKFASGLSLYYLAGNLISMGMMWGIKTYMVDEDKIRQKIENNKKKPVKKSKFQQRLEDMAKQKAKK
jgi:YidC/Oxa1 family membrane protein insertase